MTISNDDLLRIALIVAGAVFMPVGLYHRIRAHTGEKLDRWQEGAVILFGLRLSGLAVVVAATVWLIHPPWMAWSSLSLPIWLRWLGVGAAVVGGGLFSWSVHTLGKNLTDTVVTRKEHSLVTVGPYRWVRHPFYMACLLGAVGCGLAMANWLLLMLVGTGSVFIFVRTKKEERNLVERFGDDYRKYMAKTGRFLPRIRTR